MPVYLSLIFISLLPFITWPLGIYSYETPKFYFLLFSSISISVFSLFKLVFNSSFKPVLNKTLNCLVFVYWLIVFFADIFGLEPKYSLLGSPLRHQGFLTLTANLLLFYSLVLIPPKKPFKSKFLYLPLVSFFCLVFFVFFQAFNFFIYHNYSVPTYNNRLVGTLGNPGFLGGYVLFLSLFLVFELARYIKINLLLKVFVVLSAFGVIFFTKSRDALLSGLFVLAVYLVNRINKSKVSKIYKKIVLISLVPIILSFVYLFNIGFVNRFSIWENRNFIWRGVLEAVIRKPIIGYGQENLEISLPYQKMIRIDNAHNLFLEILVSSGFLGLLVFLLILLKVYQNTNFSIKILLLSFLIRAQFNPLSLSEISFFWFLLGWSQVFSIKKLR